MLTAGWFYDLLMKPLGWLGLDRLRRRLVGSARGRTLEIGVGTGLNLDLYEQGAAPLVALDVDRDGLLQAHRRLPRALLVQASVEALPFRDVVFNTAVSCLVFCTVPNPAAGLDEVHRVLKDAGVMMMLEHVRPPGRFLGWLADRLTPTWSRLAGGCRLNRRTAEALSPAGFRRATVGRLLRGTVLELRALR